MAAPPVTKTVTYEEWLRMPEVSEGREEVVNGEIRYMPPCKYPHARVLHRIHAQIVKQLDWEAFLVLAGSFGLIIGKSPLTCREPDLAVFEQASVVEEDGYFHSAPQLLIEILSPSENRKIKEEKLRDYESIATPEVWIVGPDSRTVEVLHYEDGKLRRTAILAEGLLKPRLLPSVQIDIAKIWPD